MLLRWEIFTRPTRKPWLNQAYQAFEVEILNQIYQKTLVKPGLPGFWGGNFQSGLPGKPGNTRLTKHFWLGVLSRDLSYQTFMVNYNQAYLESLVKPGSTRLSILIDNCQKPGKSGSTRVYQARQAFNQDFCCKGNSQKDQTNEPRGSHWRKNVWLNFSVATCICTIYYASALYCCCAVSVCFVFQLFCSGSFQAKQFIIHKCFCIY